MASSEAAGDVSDGPQSSDCFGVVTLAERLYRKRQGPSHITREHRVVVISIHRSGMSFQNRRGCAPAIRTHEGHHRVRIVEGVVSGRRERLPTVGQRGPTAADVDAAELQAPQQRRRIDHIEHDRGVLAIDRPVEQREDLIDLPDLEMEKREVPPVVNTQEAVASPGIRVRAHPGNTIRRASLHLHHVRDGVLRPAIARLELDGPAALRLRAPVVGCFLETERMHAEQGVEARHTLAPGGQGACDPVAQHAGVPSEEVDLMARLKCERVLRVFDRYILEDPSRLVPTSFDNVANRLKMAGLAAVRGQLQRCLP